MLQILPQQLDMRDPDQVAVGISSFTLRNVLNIFKMVGFEPGSEAKSTAAYPLPTYVESKT
jgi:hypothetical protein